jgi:hypothetical protein
MPTLGDERGGIARPAALDGKARQVDLVAAKDDFLTGAALDGARPGVGDRLQLLQLAELVT